MLPDNVLLEIFDFYRKDSEYTYRGAIWGEKSWRWHLVVHVCRKWRQVVFGSPLRLDLKISCTNKTPARKNFSIWPEFPIIVHYDGSLGPREGSVIAALARHPDRVSSVTLLGPGSQLGMVATVMQEHFPVLAHLIIESWNGTTPVPGGFLGGSAPCLQTIFLRGVPFPALPTLLLSTHDLVRLDILGIPLTGFISPEAMIVGLSALPRLEIFCMKFSSVAPRRSQVRATSPVTRVVLPALARFEFKGTSEYLEDLVACIDSPQLDLDQIHIVFLNQLVDF
jgi:hypothetical protein